MTSRGSYVHKPMVTFSGASRKCKFDSIFSKYWWFQTKRFTRLLEHKQNALENVLIFIIYQNYTLALKRLRQDLPLLISISMLYSTFFMSFWHPPDLSKRNRLRCRIRTGGSSSKVIRRNASTCRNTTVKVSISLVNMQEFMPILLRNTVVWYRWVKYEIYFLQVLKFEIMQMDATGSKNQTRLSPYRSNCSNNKFHRHSKQFSPITYKFNLRLILNAIPYIWERIHIHVLLDKIVNVRGLWFWNTVNLA